MSAIHRTGGSLDRVSFCSVFALRCTEREQYLLKIAAILVVVLIIIAIGVIKIIIIVRVLLVWHPFV